MAHSFSHWQITPEAYNGQAFAILSQDPVWNCFALADLEPPLVDYCQFAVASRNTSPERALCLIMRHPIIGQVLSPFGEEVGVAAILTRIALPERPLIQAQERHIPMLQRYYQAETTWRRQLRMAITQASWRSVPAAPPQPVVQLALSDLSALKDLYRKHPESAFSADLFPHALYFGVYHGDRIIAAGGTHALGRAHRIAVLGNILTAPEARGHQCDSHYRRIGGHVIGTALLVCGAECLRRQQPCHSRLPAPRFSNVSLVVDRNRRAGTLKRKRAHISSALSA